MLVLLTADATFCSLFSEREIDDKLHETKKKLLMARWLGSREYSVISAPGVLGTREYSRRFRPLYPWASRGFSRFSSW